MSAANLPPFINSTGLISKIFQKIQEAQEPDRYTQDFQGTVLGYGSGSARPFIPFLKRLGFLEPDGRPTEIYRRFRNADTAPTAMADAIRHGYKELFKRNEYCYRLAADKLKNLVVEVTGKEKASTSVQAIVASFNACKAFADFEAAPNSSVEHIETDETPILPVAERSPSRTEMPSLPQMKMSFGYTINLNLPNTDDPKVFNAIFRVLKDNLLAE
jgi:hypothetical protein